MYRLLKYNKNILNKLNYNNINNKNKNYFFSTILKYNKYYQNNSNNTYNIPNISLLALLIGTGVYTYHREQYDQYIQLSSNFQFKPKLKSFNKNMYSCTFPANDPIEDRHIMGSLDDSEMDICAVFDGHGGFQVSDYVHLNLPKELDLIISKNKNNSDMNKLINEAFDKVENQVKNIIKPAHMLGFDSLVNTGSCALVILRKDNNIWIANSGDCRAVLGTFSNKNGNFLSSFFNKNKNKDNNINAIPLTFDHNAREKREVERLKKDHPGEDDIVICKSPDSCYVKGRLQPTHSFGDFHLKEVDCIQRRSLRRAKRRYKTMPYITHRPEIFTHEINENNDQFIILGTDGVWDFLSNDEAVNIVQNAIKDGQRDNAAYILLENVLKKAAEESNMKYSDIFQPLGKMRRGIHDDTTIIIYYL